MGDKNQNFHEYDGIIEHDNPLPLWWLWTFFLTIIFSFIYYLHYEIAGGPTLQDELKVAMQEIETMKSKTASLAPLESEESLRAEFSKDEMIAIGAAQYETKCASCHGQNLQGLVGPNLTDKFWIHGKGTRMDLVKVIREGVSEKGMPPWGSAMKKPEIYAVSSYILSKKGTSPNGAKAPEGTPIEEYLK